MHRNVITLTSFLALSIGIAGFSGASQAHAGDKLCNVLLDGDGEPVKGKDSDVVNHSNSHACGADDKAEDAVSNVAAVEAPAPVAVAPEPVTLEPLTVYFDSGSDGLSPGSQTQVQAFAEQITATNPKGLRVVGYTDTTGSAALNKKLSQARAANVVALLIDAGVPADLVARESNGEDNLAVQTPDGTKEANNRRVTVTPDY